MAFRVALCFGWYLVRGSLGLVLGTWLAWTGTGLIPELLADWAALPVPGGVLRYLLHLPIALDPWLCGWVPFTSHFICDASCDTRSTVQKLGCRARLLARLSWLTICSVFVFGHLLG